MSKKLNIIDISKSFNEERYVLLSDEYVNAKTKLEYLCTNGHKHSITWSDWKSGYRCPYCANNARKSYKQIIKLFEDEGYSVINKKRKNNKTFVVYECPNKHEHKVRLDHFIRGTRCPYCSGVKKKNIEEVRLNLKDENYTLLSDKYENIFGNLIVRCPEGHVYEVTYHNWLQGRRCGVCNGGIKFTEEEVRNKLASEGYSLNSEYINSSEPLEVVCPNGHIYTVRFNNWSHKNSRCVKCSGNGSSYIEIELRDYLLDKNTEILTNTKDIIPPYELDIIIPSKKIAIEYCGLYWHSELNGKNRKYHLNKLNMCREKGVRLITIFEDEWLDKKDIVKSRLDSIIGDSKYIKIHARSCEIKDINTASAKNFCENNHLQGYGAGAHIKLGAFLNKELVAVMTFAKPSIAKGSRTKKDLVWELHRFCSRKNVRVVGGASKLLKYFERNYDWKELFSYADRRWSDGNLYEKLGFTFDSNTDPNYWYFKNKKRIHRFALRKNMEDDRNLTEWENRKLNGWDRIWDCGNIKYVKYV